MIKFVFDWDTANECFLVVFARSKEEADAKWARGEYELDECV